MTDLKILIACEYSGRTRDAFIKRGFNAVSCDILDTESPGPHIKGDILDVLDDGWDLMIAHPPCTYLASSGLHWNKKNPERAQKTEDSLVFVEKLLNAPIKYIALENPIGIISTRIRKPDQYIQPYEYGEDASKKTCLWLKNLPKLKPTKIIEPRLVNGYKRWGNQRDSGHDKFNPSKDRGKLRSLTFQGWADAWAEQWGDYILGK